MKEVDVTAMKGEREGVNLEALQEEMKNVTGSTLL